MEDKGWNPGFLGEVFIGDWGQINCRDRVKEKIKNIIIIAREMQLLRPVGFPVWFSSFINFFLFFSGFPFLAFSLQGEVLFYFIIFISADEHNNLGSSTDGAFSSKSGSPKKGFLWCIQTYITWDTSLGRECDGLSPPGAEWGLGKCVVAKHSCLVALNRPSVAGSPKTGEWIPIGESVSSSYP